MSTDANIFSRGSEPTLTPRIFIVESFDETTGTGSARDIQTNVSFSFDNSGLAAEMDSVVFPGEYVTADVHGDRIINLLATAANSKD